MNKVWLVWQYPPDDWDIDDGGGPALMQAYDNEPAAKQHLAYLDGYIDELDVLSELAPSVPAAAVQKIEARRRLLVWSCLEELPRFQQWAAYFVPTDKHFDSSRKCSTAWDGENGAIRVPVLGNHIRPGGAYISGDSTMKGQTMQHSTWDPLRPGHDYHDHQFSEWQGDDLLLELAEEPPA